MVGTTTIDPATAPVAVVMVLLKQLGVGLATAVLLRPP